MSPMPVSTRARSQSGTFFTKKEKEAKRKKRVRGGLWKLPQLWKSAEKRGFPQLLGKASQNPLGFPTVTTGPAAVNINHSSLLIDLSHRWGSLHLIPNSESPPYKGGDAALKAQLGWSLTTNLSARATTPARRLYCSRPHETPQFYWQANPPDRKA